MDFNLFNYNPPSGLFSERTEIQLEGKVPPASFTVDGGGWKRTSQAWKIMLSGSVIIDVMLFRIEKSIRNVHPHGTSIPFQFLCSALLGFVAFERRKYPSKAKELS